MTQPQSFHDGRVLLYAGDCLARLDEMPENSVDSVCCDPPYHLLSTVERFAKTGDADRMHNADHQYGRLSRGFMNKDWDGGDIAFRAETWRKVLRVMKPGAHMVAFGASKNAHRMFCAIEDAGFEIRDTLLWLYGTGFPKSHNLDGEWEGWGSALKPAFEPICLARKPLSEKTIAANVLRWGTGALNIDGCRVGYENDAPNPATNPLFRAQNGYKNENASDAGSSSFSLKDGSGERAPVSAGRWPANIVHDGSDEVVAAFPDSDGQNGVVNGQTSANLVYGARGARPLAMPRGDAGSAARFFYSAKADASDRIGSKHPTVKPVSLMQWCVRLITPPGGTVLDCFAGTGSSGEAAFREGMKAILIEREPEYQADIERRMEMALLGPDGKAHAILKARNLVEDAGPLFGGTDHAGGVWETDIRPLRRPKRSIGPIGLKR